MPYKTMWASLNILNMRARYSTYLNEVYFNDSIFCLKKRKNQYFHCRDCLLINLI